MFYFTLAAFLITGIYGFITYGMIRSDLEKEMGERLAVAGKIINSSIDPLDIPYMKYGGKVRSKYLLRLMSVKTVTGVNDILVIDRNRKIVLSLLDPEEKFFVGLDEYEMGKAFKGETIASPLYRGAFNKYYKTVYVPAGEPSNPAGIIGVEASAEYMKYIGHYRSSLAVAAIVIIFISFILSIIISTGITSSIRALRDKAEQIAKRNFDEHIEIKGEEEIKVLATALDSMKNELNEYIKNREKMATVGEFSAGVAHEIRNSLNVLSGYAELIRERAADEKVKKHADDILKSVMKMAGFVNNFLTYTKEFIPELQKINMHKFVTELKDELPDNIKEVLRVNYPGQNAEVMMDPYLMKMAVHNIIINAYQALDKPEKSIVMTAEENGGKAVISIKDNGKGIKESEKGKIFQPFYTGRREGTGLGLAIAYRIVKEIHGGDIFVESTENQGTEFRLLLG
jgi:signal transduction histidine kinase